MTKSKSGKGPGKSRPQKAPGGGQGRRSTPHRRAAAPSPTTARGGGLWLYGTHAVRAALANPRRQLHRLLATADAAADLEDIALPKDLSLERLPREELSRQLPEGAVHQGLAALVAPLPTLRLEKVLAEAPQAAGERQVLLVLDQITDPQNCGAVLRSAAAFGALAVVAHAHHAAPESGALAKAASGALELMPRVEVGNLSQALRQMQAAGYWVLGLAEEGPATLTAGGSDDHGPRVALVLGAEGRGLRRLTRETCDLLVRLPTRPALPSLNVSNAAAVALFALLAR
ncbi:MAG TPA: 23S rRNA (guanosine(2251)-2'-O)-methyltransferase RlmB [Kiloniellaceae bacterium]|nr:23S rRNA (guanosine(2251)-2'-O)-methyltransferase RlmB [Kiloniellaceae bacterium]